MAAFPPLEPTRRAWSMGDYPVTMQPAWGMAPFGFRHGLSPTAHTLTLTFELITSLEAARIRNHYHGQRGGLLPFDLPPIVWRGSSSATGPVSDSTQWRYAATPQETHLIGSRVNLAVELEAVL